MHRDLFDEGHQRGQHRTARQMCENPLIAPQERRFQRTKHSEHTLPVVPKLVAPGVTADDPDLHWGAPSAQSAAALDSPKSRKRCAFAKSGTNLWKTEA
jgi:hypothetical protein